MYTVLDVSPMYTESLGSVASLSSCSVWQLWHQITYTTPSLLQVSRHLVFLSGQLSLWQNSLGKGLLGPGVAINFCPGFSSSSTLAPAGPVSLMDSLILFASSELAV